MGLISFTGYLFRKKRKKNIVTSQNIFLKLIEKERKRDAKERKDLVTVLPLAFFVH